MDLQQAGGSAIQDYGNALTNLQNQDAQNRAFINARQDRYLRSTQQAPSDTVQTAATGTPDSGQLPASPDTSAPVAPQPAASTATPAQAPAPTASPDSSNAELSRLSRAGTVQPFLPNTGLLNVGVNKLMDATGMGQNSPAAQQARLAALKKTNDTTEATQQVGPTSIPANASVADRFNNPGNLKFAGQPGATKGPALPDGTSFAVFPDMSTGLTAAQNQLHLDMGRGNNTVQGLISKWSPPTASGNSAASTNAYITRVASQLGVSPTQPLTPDFIPKMAQVMYGVEAGHPAGTPVPTTASAQAPQAQAAAAQPGTPQPQAAQQGPKFTAADGTPFTVPQQYNDGQIQQMQQQAAQIKNATQLAWLHYQNGTSPDNSQVMQLQQAGQQLNQHLYDADIYAKTQQAQAGSPTAFSALLNEYSNKVGQPIQVMPEGNNMYSLRAKGGQVIAHGDPASLAGTLGGVLNSGARAMAMELAKTKATSYATESGKAEAGMPVEMAKLQTELAKQMGVNASDQIVAKIKTGELKVTTNINGQFLITDPATGKSTLLDPTKATAIGTPTSYHQNLP